MSEATRCSLPARRHVLQDFRPHHQERRRQEPKLLLVRHTSPFSSPRAMLTTRRTAPALARTNTMCRARSAALTAIPTYSTKAGTWVRFRLLSSSHLHELDTSTSPRLSFGLRLSWRRQRSPRRLPPVRCVSLQSTHRGTHRAHSDAHIFYVRPTFRSPPGSIACIDAHAQESRSMDICDGVPKWTKHANGSVRPHSPASSDILRRRTGAHGRSERRSGRYGQGALIFSSFSHSVTMLMSRVHRPNEVSANTTKATRLIQSDTINPTRSKTERALSLCLTSHATTRKERGKLLYTQFCMALEIQQPSH